MYSNLSHDTEYEFSVVTINRETATVPFTVSYWTSKKGLNRSYERVACMGILTTPDPQIYLVLMFGIRASLGLDVAIFQHFTRLQAFIRGIVMYCDFFHSKTGINNRIQYAPVSLCLAYSCEVSSDRS